jgi:hypothetical protein
VVVDLSKKYRNRFGHPVTLVTDKLVGDGPYCVGGVVHGSAGDYMCNWTIEGDSKAGCDYHSNDLVEISPFEGVAADTPVWIRIHRDSTDWLPAHFSHVSGTGDAYCFAQGRTSHTNGGITTCPLEMRLASEFTPEGRKS